MSIDEPLLYSYIQYTIRHLAVFSRMYADNAEGKYDNFS